jgi:hypothetical protein
LVHEKSVELFLLPVDDCFLNDQFTLFNQFNPALRNEYEPISHKGKDPVLGEVVLAGTREIVLKKFSLLAVQLSYFELLKTC